MSFISLMAMSLVDRLERPRIGVVSQLRVNHSLIRKEMSVSTLSCKDQQMLAQRGISAEDGVFGVEITFTTTGVAWLFNYLESSDSVGSMLTLGLLKGVANFRPRNNFWRNLRCQAVPIPVYETNYFQLFFYLEGSPPRAFHAFYPSISVVSKIFNVPLMQSGVFKVRNNQIVKIEFSDLETEQLAKGKSLCINQPA